MLKIAEPGPPGEDGLPQTYTGHGLSTNVVEASLRAYLAAINKLIAEHPAAAAARETASQGTKESPAPGATTASARP